ncbi:hypothetical protein C7212DRAFT_282708 [Tuber magnatum]|uniref:Ribosomal protein s17 n=1 Tax=Tuber magnatum TaxID=42249 RepID=A0A317SKS3_9PEZI|nr:hypothetical protein C7212DRAFT_282708 [Tuber magnatum]
MSWQPFQRSASSLVRRLIYDGLTRLGRFLIFLLASSEVITAAPRRGRGSRRGRGKGRGVGGPFGNGTDISTTVTGNDGKPTPTVTDVYNFVSATMTLPDGKVTETVVPDEDTLTTLTGANGSVTTSTLPEETGVDGDDDAVPEDEDEDETSSATRRRGGNNSEATATTSRRGGNNSEAIATTSRRGGSSSGAPTTTGGRGGNGNASTTSRGTSATSSSSASASPTNRGLLLLSSSYLIRNNGGSNGGNNGGNNGGDSSLALDPDNVQDASTKTGQEDGDDPNQADSLTDGANFINFCKGKTLTNGLQVKSGSCNGIVMGDIPSTSNMVSTIITSPTPGQNIQADTEFTVKVTTENLVAGSFTNPANTYYAAPQQLQGGKVIGHTHITIQKLEALNTNRAPDAGVFQFFKGINDPGDGNGNLEAVVTGGLPAGAYRICTLSSASNHQPVIMPIAQRGAQDDCTKFTVGGNGGNNNNGGRGQ